jgi:hypothetical protein
MAGGHAVHLQIKTQILQWHAGELIAFRFPLPVSYPPLLFLNLDPGFFPLLNKELGFTGGAASPRIFMLLV